jgi:hypothetical protein
MMAITIVTVRRDDACVIADYLGVMVIALVLDDMSVASDGLA